MSPCARVPWGQGGLMQVLGCSAGAAGMTIADITLEEGWKRRLAYRDFTRVR